MIELDSNVKFLAECSIYKNQENNISRIVLVKIEQ